MNKNNNKEKEVVVLPVGKENKNLAEQYREKKQVPFHSVSAMSLRLENVNAAQIQALGQQTK